MKCHLCDNHFEIETDPKVGEKYLGDVSLMMYFGLAVQNQMVTNRNWN